MERYQARQNALKIIKEEVDLENRIVEKLNQFNQYRITNMDDIEYVENTYQTILNEINKLTTDEKIGYYYSKLNEIRDYKDEKLIPFIEEREKMLEEERETIRQNLEVALSTLKELTEYYEGVEYQFTNYEGMLATAEEKGVDTSEYRQELESIREYIESLKPEEPVIEEPEYVEGTEDLEDEDETNSDGGSDSSSPTDLSPEESQNSNEERADNNVE
jgi:hypothetical protein